MIARAAFPRGNPYVRLRDTLGTMFADQQFAETLSDRRAADAARGRIDWKYLLGLERADPGFDASERSEFRSRLAEGGAEALLLETLLALCREQKLLALCGRSCPRFCLRSRWNGNGGGSARTARTGWGPFAPSIGWAALRLGCATATTRAAERPGRRRP